MTALRTLRKGYGYEQQKLAAKVFVSPGYLSDLEHGLKKPSPRLARAIADIFGAKVEAVFPDGCAEKVCRQRKVDAYAPPVEPAPVIYYPSRCPKCGAQVVRERCYACGYDYEVRMEEAHV
ncbi:MAG: helix-turn-helix transcriptional regulator [Chloroflexi bacterium]|nr:helix-turn-helix transcriptional regulator [Chloroflexota bacterium]